MCRYEHSLDFVARLTVGQAEIEEVFGLYRFCNCFKHLQWDGQNVVLACVAGSLALCRLVGCHGRVVSVLTTKKRVQMSWSEPLFGRGRHL